MGFKLYVYVLFLCILGWTDAQFGRISLSVGLGQETYDDEQESVRAACPPHTSCVPITSCPLLEDLMDFTCFSSDKYFHRLNQLICNNVNGEDYVCCPSCDCNKVYQVGTKQCGQSMVRGVDNNGLGAHPWVARIGFANKDTGKERYACSGSIISKRVVLSAAHCALAKLDGYKLSSVAVGEWDIDRSKPNCNDLFCAPPRQNIKVENVIVHPGYEQKIFRHDIALIVLRNEIRYSVTAAPICLNDKPEIVINERATLVGWGKLSGQTDPVSHQQLLEVPLVPLENCERIFGESVPVNEGQLCAGGEEGKDACSGFGGAPLLLLRDKHYVQDPLDPVFRPPLLLAGEPLLQLRDKHYVQLGIVSFGAENCGSEGVPSVYTNIANYYRWIIDNSPS